MRACLCNLIIAVLAVGCTTKHTDSLGTDRQGVAELHVDARPLLASSITRVTVEAAGQTQDLAFNPATQTFDSTLFLPAGTQSLVARAFSMDALVGQSHPTPIEISAGGITRVVLRIFDLTSAPPAVFGPILDSLSFPTTTNAGTTVTFAIAVIAPVGDPVTYAWSTDCADATFTAPSAPTTGWSKAAQGTCTITVIATSNGFSLVQSFGIVVFPAGANLGAVDVNTAFVTAPLIVLSVAVVGCSVAPGGNASCSGTIASPTAASYDADVFNWGGSDPGTLEVSDSCGGRFGTSSRNTGDVNGFWLPAVGGGLCFLTAHAVNADGLASTITAAALTRAGTPATARPPQLFAALDGCILGSADSAPDCGSAPTGGQREVFVDLGWDNGHPGSVTVTDDCAGPQADGTSASFFFDTWLSPNTPGATCTTTVRATNLEGVSTDAVATYHLVAPPG